ncbi:barstar family protein [Streptomyces sp. NPDC005876]|jgi:ribonuclease inhibitor|uniref:barstar family protein n=1 Tax=unclassified Streptomyces TaxID=2593676 RepID=UPI0033E42B54
MHIKIDGKRVRTASEFHAIMADALGLGSYYRPNLAALWDILSTDVERPIDVVWINSSISKAAMGDEEFHSIRDLLLRVEAQDAEAGWDERFTVQFT